MKNNEPKERVVFLKDIDAEGEEAYALYHELTDIVGYNLECVGKTEIQKSA